MTLLYIDAFSGISGDMFLGALLEAGLAEADLREALASLPIEGYELLVRKEKRGGLAATRVEVKLDPGAEQPHRHLHHIEEIINQCGVRSAECGVGKDEGRRDEGTEGRRERITRRAADKAKAVFRRLAEAEARVHGSTAEKVHFHEVGAVDAIVDIVGVCAGLEILGVERVVASPLPMGSGYVDAAHGRLPVPVPAVVELMKGFPTRPCDEEGELTTPTGAALVVTLADAFGPMPAMVIEKVGYGAGAREGKRVPNVLRVLVGRAVSQTDDAEADTVWLLEANVDDASGETLGAATQALFEAGALDVWLTAATMKKGRSGVVLACLAPEGLVAAVEDAIFRETPTFGVRRSAVERTKLAREHATVETAFGRVRVKVGRRGGRVVTASPEYEDCRRLAAERGVALREVYAAAMAAWRGKAE
ncbi:MAG: nickel pincer cofactor biosynthesis protein LarC [Phycisphaerae bacterium]